MKETIEFYKTKLEQANEIVEKVKDLESKCNQADETLKTKENII